MDHSTETCVATQSLITGLRRPDAYPHLVVEPVDVHQTHISIVFLAGDYAYKIKKPVKTDFLDYSTLELRKRFCEEEVRLDSRYASDLYLGVVPVTQVKGQSPIGGDGEIVDYAVKMRRFPKGALLSERSDAGKLTTADVFVLAQNIARFHAAAKNDRNETAIGWPGFLVGNFHQVIVALHKSDDHERVSVLSVLKAWSEDFFCHHLGDLAQRVEAGFVRECHGDLHLANIVLWGDHLVPFDGIEFNEHLRWIDVLSDAAFLAMDLAAHNHLDLNRTFLNAYLEWTGDYQSLELLRLFLVYRSLVRALTSSMRGDDHDVQDQIDLAYRFTLREEPRLWITHGVSGSGKTTLSESVVQRHQAFRLRSDIERKRMFGLAFHERPSRQLALKIYGEQANEQTYERLADLANDVLRSGYSVIVDATFLKFVERKRFRDLANELGVGFAILDCHSDLQTLRQRVADRLARSDDASDADLTVLKHQLAFREPLTPAEQAQIVDIPDPIEVVQSL